MIYRKQNKPSVTHPLFIGFAGRERSGKTTAASYIKNKYGGEVLAFADALKGEVFDLNAIRGSELADFLTFAKSKGYDFDFHSLPKTNLNNPKRADKIAWLNRNKPAFGSIMQIYGDYKRSKNPSYFVDKTLFAIQKLKEDLDPFVICVDDLRFGNEADALTNIGFTIVRINTSDEIRAARGACRDASHPSETQLDSYFYQHHVYNNLEIHDLYAQLDAVVLEILNRE